eukprot:4750517-Pyramimonas_sp.AAC.1
MGPHYFRQLFQYGPKGAREAPAASPAAHRAPGDAHTTATRSTRRPVLDDGGGARSATNYINVHGG